MDNFLHTCNFTEVAAARRKLAINPQKRLHFIQETNRDLKFLQDLNNDWNDHQQNFQHFSMFRSGFIDNFLIFCVFSAYFTGTHKISHKSASED